jgi:uncharacterized protein (TIGR04255 family)
MEFNNAPVAEVVVGAQFEGITFENRYLYDFYQKIKSDFPFIQEQQPLPSVIEKIDVPNENRIIQGFNTRKFFISKPQNKLIQLQPDKFLFNWRRTNNNSEYPHFSVVLNEFLSVYSKLNSDLNLNARLNQLEVTYVDHIYIDDFGLKDYELNKIFKFINLNKNLKTIESQYLI